MEDISRRIGLTELAGGSQGAREKHDNPTDEKQSQEHID